MPVHRHPIAFVPGDDSFAKFPLDEELIGRLRDSFDIIRENGARLGERFYARLFEAAPNLRPMFKGDLKAQATKLVDSLDAVIRNLERPTENAVMLAELGKRHVGYGAKPEHYELVISLLTQSMREVLGDQADERCLDEWRQALRLISRQMIAAGESEKR